MYQKCTQILASMIIRNECDFSFRVYWMGNNDNIKIVLIVFLVARLTVGQLKE